MLARLLFALALVAPLASQADWKAFCADVKTWKKGEPVPAAEKYSEAGFANVVKAQFVHENLDKPDYVLIDARSEADRGVGKLPKSIMLTSDDADPAKNEFVKDKFITTVAKYMAKNKKSKVPASAKKIEDLGGTHYMLFCNGPKCHRSTYAACQMREWGIPAEKIHIMTGGFPEWKEAGYPTR